MMSAAVLLVGYVVISLGAAVAVAGAAYLGAVAFKALLMAAWKRKEEGLAAWWLIAATHHYSKTKPVPAGYKLKKPLPEYDATPVAFNAVASKTPLYDMAQTAFPKERYPLILWQGLVRQVEEENFELKAKIAELTAAIQVQS